MTPQTQRNAEFEIAPVKENGFEVYTWTNIT